MRLHRIGFFIRNFLDQPRRVALVCILFIGVTAVGNGVLWRLWALHRDHSRRLHDMIVTQETISQLKDQLAQAKDPVFIERQARDRLDLASDKDLMFVFPTQ